MRPTYLQFRSPKEQTGEFLNPKITNDGKNLTYQTRDYVKSNFPRGQRWQHIKELACRTSFKVGPGCYNTPMTTNKGIGPKILKPSATLSNGWDYMYVGDSIVKKDRPESRRSNASFRNTNALFSEKKSPSQSHYSFYECNPINYTLKSSKTRPYSAGRRREPLAEDLREFSATQNLGYNNGMNAENDRLDRRAASQGRSRPSSEKKREQALNDSYDENWTINQKLFFRHPSKKRIEN